MDVQEEFVSAMARLEAGLGRRWTAEDASRVIGWMEGEIETRMAPTALERFRSHFLDCIAYDEPEYEDILDRAIYHDLESLITNDGIDIDIDDLAPDIFFEARGLYFNPQEGDDPMNMIIQEEEEEEEYSASEFSDSETGDDDGSELSEEEILEYPAFEFSDSETGDDVGSGLSEGGILNCLNKVIIRVGEEGRICVVCQDEEAAVTVAIRGCGHVYHMGCIKRWLQFRDFCPLCRARVGQHHHQDEDDVQRS